MRNNENFFGVSPRITPWLEKSDFESYLAEEAGKSKIARQIYAEYYRSLNPAYYEKGKKAAYAMMEERPHQYGNLDKEDVYADMVYCLHRFGYSFQDYCIYDFTGKSDSERLEFVADKLRYHYCDLLNAPEISPLMTDKYLCYQTYKEFFKRSMVRVAEENDYLSFQSFINEHPKFIYKPLKEHSGHGITIVDSNKTDIRAWFHDTVKNNPGVMEELIDQGEEMNKMNPHSINSCRIVAFTDGSSVTLLGGALRMGCGDAITDNAGSGGIYASIDVSTGKLQSDAQNYHNIHYSNHPTTGQTIKGFQLPKWNEAVDLIKRMALKIKGTTLIAWDIAYSKRGWIMVEANENGDWSIIQSNLQIGKKKELFKYMGKYLNAKQQECNTLNASELTGGVILVTLLLLQMKKAAFSYNAPRSCGRRTGRTIQILLNTRPGQKRSLQPTTSKKEWKCSDLHTRTLHFTNVSMTMSA